KRQNRLSSSGLGQISMSPRCKISAASTPGDRAVSTLRAIDQSKETIMSATTALKPAAPAVPDLAPLHGRPQAGRSSGDYAIVGTTLQIVGEALCEALDLRPGSKVLDVAAGNGNATLAAARRFTEVVSTDYVGALLERGRERAEAERLPVTFQE